MTQQLTCPKCQKTNEFNTSIAIKVFSCQHCNSLFRRKSDKSGWEFLKGAAGIKKALQLGDDTLLDGKKFILTGILSKYTHKDSKWTEYILNSEDGDYIVLTESDGHWIKMNPVDEAPANDLKESYCNYKGTEYKLFEKGIAHTRSAVGCFDFDPFPEQWLVETYIRDIWMLSVEGNGSKQEYYWGEYSSYTDLRRYFPKIKRVFPHGIGIVQPFFIPVKSSTIIGLITLLMMLIIQFATMFNSNRKVVYDNTITLLDSVNNKEYTTPSFELKGASAPLSIQLTSSIDNNWAAMNIGLVNEYTSETQYATADIEYYHGYEDGENWSEGAANKKFNICGVPSGKYHLVLSPSFETSRKDSTVKALYTPPAAQINLHIVWQQTYRNLIIFGVTILILILLIKIADYMYDREKWRPSDYSDYHYEN